MTEADRPTVLAVDADGDAVARYERVLEDDYELRVAETGEAALAAYDATVDVVVLDRELPDLDGDLVLERIRERPSDCRVAVVTAVDPGFDIIEMPFDDYLVEPVSDAALRESVKHLAARLRYRGLLTEYYRVASKLAALEATKSDRELAASEEFAALEAQAAELQGEVTATLEALDDYASAFEEVLGPGPR